MGVGAWRQFIFLEGPQHPRPPPTHPTTRFIIKTVCPPEPVEGVRESGSCQLSFSPRVPANNRGKADGPPPPLLLVPSAVPQCPPIPCWHLHLQLGNRTSPPPLFLGLPASTNFGDLLLRRPHFTFIHLENSFWIPSFNCDLPPTPLSPNYPFPCTKGRGVQPRWRRHCG